MNRLYLIIGMALLFIAPAYSEDDIDWTTSGSVHYAAIPAETATSVTGTAQLLIPDGASVASILVKSGTASRGASDAYSGAISNASITVAMSPASTALEYMLTDAVYPTSYELERGNAADTSVWMALPTISNYGLYNVPVGSNRSLRLWIARNGAVTVATIFVRFDDG